MLVKTFKNHSRLDACHMRSKPKMPFSYVYPKCVKQNSIFNINIHV